MSAEQTEAPALTPEEMEALLEKQGDTPVTCIAAGPDWDTEGRSVRYKFALRSRTWTREDRNAEGSDDGTIPEDALEPFLRATAWIAGLPGNAEESPVGGGAYSTLRLYGRTVTWTQGPSGETDLRRQETDRALRELIRRCEEPDAGGSGT